MKTIVSKYLVVSVLALLTWTSCSFAGSELPVSKQKTDKSDEKEKIEIVPVVKIDSESSTKSTTNPKLKQGNACDFDNLEEAEGELIVDIPMAKTEPCDKVGCKGLKPAKMLDDNYIELKTAKTISCDKDK